MTMVDGAPQWNAETCKGCSSCAIHCPQKAITIEIEDVKAAVDDLLERLSPQVGGLDLENMQMDL